jgi:hypothetical protein
MSGRSGNRRQAATALVPISPFALVAAPLSRTVGSSAQPVQTPGKLEPAVERFRRPRGTADAAADRLARFKLQDHPCAMYSHSPNFSPRHRRSRR